MKKFAFVTILACALTSAPSFAQVVVRVAHHQWSLSALDRLRMKDTSGLVDTTVGMEPGMFGFQDVMSLRHALTQSGCLPTGLSATADGSSSMGTGARLSVQSDSKMSTARIVLGR